MINVQISSWNSSDDATRFGNLHQEVVVFIDGVQAVFLFFPCVCGISNKILICEDESCS